MGTFGEGAMINMVSTVTRLMVNGIIGYDLLRIQGRYRASDMARAAYLGL